MQNAVVKAAKRAAEESRGRVMEKKKVKEIVKGKKQIEKVKEGKEKISSMREKAKKPDKRK